jgi:TrmH family RNA methyltransferase
MKRCSYHSPVQSTDLTPRFRSARTDPALAVLEGFHAIKHAIRFGAEFESVATWDRAGLREFAERLAPDVGAELGRLAVEVPRDIFDQLSPTPPDTGVIAIARRRVTSLGGVLALSQRAPIVLLESPSHSGNIGAVIRVAAAAGAAAVVTTGPIDPWNPGAIRGSAGLHFAVPVIRMGVPEIGARELIAIDPDGDELTRSAIPSGAVLAFGSERSGLSSAMLAKASRRIRIPMQPGVSSLNLATAAAVVLYRWRLQQ